MLPRSTHPCWPANPAPSMWLPQSQPAPQTSHNRRQPVQRARRIPQLDACRQPPLLPTTPQTPQAANPRPAPIDPCAFNNRNNAVSRMGRGVARSAAPRACLCARPRGGYALVLLSALAVEHDDFDRPDQNVGSRSVSMSILATQPLETVGICAALLDGRPTVQRQTRTSQGPGSKHRSPSA